MKSLLQQIERVRVDSLIVHPANPRRGNVEVIAASLEANQQFEPLVVQRSTGHVLAGNHRLLAARSLGWEEMDVVFVDVDDEQAVRILLVANRSSDLATYDDSQLAALLKPYYDQDLLLGTGYDSGLVERLLRADEKARANVDDAPPIPPEPKSKLGEVYELGNHRLACGDNASEVLGTLMGDTLADLLWTDPPYGVSYAGKNEYLNAIAPGYRIQVPIEGDHRTPVEMSALWEASFTACRPWLTEGASYYVTGPQGGDLLLLLLRALRTSGFPLRHILIWAKNNHVLGRADYNYQHEPIIFGWVKGRHQFYGGGGETSLWEIPKPQSSKLHPTMKPVALVERAIRNSTKPGMVVLDPFAGSGSTLIAAELTDRRCFAVELDAGYCDVIRQRYANHVGDQGFAP